MRAPATTWSHLVKVAVLMATLTMAASIGHDGRRMIQVVLLGMPVILWTLWPLQQRPWIRLRAALIHATLWAFMIDALIRVHLRQHYDATPDSALVITATANSTPREITEYLALQAAMLSPGLILALIVALTTTAIVRLHLNAPAAPSRPVRWLVIGLLTLGAIGLLSKPWRKHHPLVFWPDWAQQVIESRTRLTDRIQARQQLMANAHAAAPSVALEGPATVVLVLGDSVNRDNMNLYGYARPTTPQLAALRDALGPSLLQVRYAWSTEAGTLASLAHILGFGRDAHHPETTESQHLVALARAAGYRVWWLSNHDDYGIEQQHARLANHVEMINRKPGRSTTSLDGELLKRLPAVFQDPWPRKLVVLHMLGAHPHYRLRRPEDWPFPQTDNDLVDPQMAKEGRPLWLRTLRREYDAAIHYHDWVVAETLRMTQTHTPAQGYAAWMFLSDHGQEVGHVVSRAGHSPGTPAGYRIPLLLWRSGPPFDPAAAHQPFRADWSSWTLAELMHLRWPGRRESQHIVHPEYQWKAPRLKIELERFDH
jgi:heptose-I-phosphate ethanolaminephosphotransferase